MFLQSVFIKQKYKNFFVLLLCGAKNLSTIQQKTLSLRNFFAEGTSINSLFCKKLINVELRQFIEIPYGALATFLDIC